MYSFKHVRSVGYSFVQFKKKNILNMANFIHSFIVRSESEWFTGDTPNWRYFTRGCARREISFWLSQEMRSFVHSLI